MSPIEFEKVLKVGAGDSVDLAKIPTRRTDAFPKKDDAHTRLKADQRSIGVMQEQLFASKCKAVLIVLQGMDTAGKSGTTKAVFAHCAPLGLGVQPFKRPTKQELAHDFLWRAHKTVPERGAIKIFDRSYYEDVLVVKVKGMVSDKTITQRYQQINEFERMLTENGMLIVKFMLHISYAEQGERLTARLRTKEKHWKFDPGDLEDRALWPDFMEAYEVMLSKCSTSYAPWYIIPSDSRARRNAYIASIIRQKLSGLGLDWPETEHSPDDFVGKL